MPCRVLLPLAESVGVNGRAVSFLPDPEPRGCGVESMPHDETHRATTGRFHMLRAITDRRWLIAAVVLVLVAMASACGDDDATTTTQASTSTTPAAAGPSEEDLAYVDAQIAQYRECPPWAPPGPAFDARAAMEGKLIFVLPYFTAIPFNEAVLAGVKEGAELGGFDVELWPSQGDQANWQQGIQTAITLGADLLEIFTINTDVLKPQIQQFQDTGGLVVSSHVLDPTQTEFEYLDGIVRYPYERIGRLLADWVIYKTRGDVDVLIITANDSVSTPPFVEGIRSEFEERCGLDSCRLSYIDIPTTEWGTRVTPDAQGAIIANPDLDYIIPIYDAMVPGVVTAMNITETVDQIKVISFNGSTNVLDLIREGSVEMDIGEDLGWVGRLQLDYDIRLLAGLDPEQNIELPIRIWDQSNVEEAGVPAQMSTGYCDNDEGRWEELWQLGG